MAVPRSLRCRKGVRDPGGPADPPPAGSAGRSGEGQLRAPSTAATSVGTAAFGASAAADAAKRRAYRNMASIIADAPSGVEWFSGGRGQAFALRGGQGGDSGTRTVSSATSSSPEGAPGP